MTTTQIKENWIWWYKSKSYLMYIVKHIQDLMQPFKKGRTAKPNPFVQAMQEGSRNRSITFWMAFNKLLFAFLKWSHLYLIIFPVPYYQNIRKNRLAYFCCSSTKWVWTDSILTNLALCIAVTTEIKSFLLKPLVFCRQTWTILQQATSRRLKVWLFEKWRKNEY